MAQYHGYIKLMIVNSITCIKSVLSSVFAIKLSFFKEKIRIFDRDSITRDLHGTCES